MKILIGISAGISAYKICDLVRLFKKDDHEVKVVVTENAKKLVSTVTLETLSQNKVYSDVFDTSEGVLHIELARWADLMIVAPASANVLAKMASGLSDQLLLNIILALDKPCYIFPSMNTTMYTHPSVQENIIKLSNWGYVIHEPVEGHLACGESGKGRLPEVNHIYEVVLGEVERSRIDSPLLGKRMIITAGSTKSYIDPVRFIMNSSSGRMGVELVREAWLRGVQTTLICNTDVIDKFNWVRYYTDEIVNIVTTEDVMNEVSHKFKDCDIYISAAALSDFKNNPKTKKIKKNKNGNTLELQPAIDVFSELSNIRENQTMVGFALESDELEWKAMEKLKNKGMDMVVANNVEAIGAKSSDVYIMDQKGIRKFIKNTDKRIVAREILDELENLISEKL